MNRASHGDQVKVPPSISLASIEGFAAYELVLNSRLAFSGRCQGA